MLNLRIARGRCLPLGTVATPDGVNFALLSRHATAVTLVLYELDGKQLISEIALHPRRNRTGQIWHVLVQGLPPSFCFGWRVDGKHGPGHCFDPSLVLIDPAARAVSGAAVWGSSEEPDLKSTPRRSVFIQRSFNWQEDVPPLTPLEDSI